MEEHEKYLQYKFPGQADEEHIQVLVRKHWIVDVKVTIFFVILVGIPSAITLAVAIFAWDKTLDATSLLVMQGLWAYLLLIFSVLYMAWLNEELDVVIVTNERIVSHDQVDVFHKQISETSIAQIQDVKGVEKGMWGNLFNYGSLEVQTAAKDIIFNIEHVKDPYSVARKILDVRDRYLDKEKFERPPMHTAGER